MDMHLESKEIMTEIGNFAFVSSKLRIVLYPGKAWNTKYAILLHIVPNVCAAVIIDSPESVMWLPRKQLREWKKELPEVFEIALENTIQSAKPELIRHSFRDKELISLAGDIFTATLILNLRNTPDFFGEFGSLVSMYGQNRLLIYKVEDEEVIQDLPYFVWVHLNILKDEKVIVSQAIFWCSNQDIQEVEYRIKKNKEIECALPKQLEKLLADKSSA